MAKQVAEQLMDHDALGAHARDEIGISESVSAQPVQAAFYSAGTFTVGATLPLIVACVFPGSILIPAIAVFSIVFLAVLGGLAAHAGGASVAVGVTRVTIWGPLAMGLTAAVGRIFGVVA